jgi:iron-sulfur cluster repair protein YtfE (RIC family)
MDAVRTAHLLDTTVGELALSDVRICAALMAAGADFGEDGDHTLAELCRRPGNDMTLADTIVALDRGVSLATEPRLDAVCAAVVAHHHESLRAAMEGLRRSWTTVADTFDGDTTLIAGARARFERLAEAVQSHFAKEEYILFPAFATLAETHERGGALPRLPFPSVAHPIRAMEGEHHHIEADLAWLRTFTADFQVAGVHDAAWSRLGRALDEVAQQLIAHACFENDYLSPHALDLERQLLARDETPGPVTPLSREWS